MNLEMVQTTTIIEVNKCFYLLVYDYVYAMCFNFYLCLLLAQK